MSVGGSPPRLRWPLDVQPLIVEGENLFLIRDPQGLAPEVTIVPPPVVFVLSLLDGTNELERIVERAIPLGFARDDIDSLLVELDNRCLLETERAARRWDEIRGAYADSPVREAALAGKAYAEDPLELIRYLTGVISGARQLEIAPGREVPALISPHIDYQRGSPVYASAFRALERIEPAEVVFLIGTSHQAGPGEGPFILSKKRFECPLGTFPVASDVLQELCTRYGAERALRDEILHRTEHSLELQLPFLAYRHRGKPMPALVPILVGSFHQSLEANRFPEENDEIGDFIAALAEVLKGLRTSGRRVLLYGGVDLAHMGTFFGDVARVSDTQLPLIESRDRELLDAILSGDEQRLFAHMAEDCDRRRICGFPSIYTMLRALRLAGVRCEGRLLDYRQAVDAQSDCVVTMASAYWMQ